MSRFLDIQLDMASVNRAAAGDREAQQLLYDQVAGPMFGLIRRMLRDGAAAEDVFQDSMIAVLKHLPVKAGVLVVRAGVDSSLKLQDGDVILAIDGREATTAQQAGRILRSYQPGEKLTLKVQRDRKNLNIDAIAPGGVGRN